jgi:hypothetical protein
VISSRAVIDMLRHAIGVQQYGRRRWTLPKGRNSYFADGPDVVEWDALCAAGLARRVREPSDLTGGAVVFVVTDEGKSIAMEGLIPRRYWAYGC